MVGRPQPTSENSVDLTRRYLAELGSYPLLTAEDESTLAQAIAEGRVAEAKLADRDATWSRRERSKLQATVRGAAEARRRFIQSNLRLVVSIAKRYQTPSMSLLDLIQEGNLGLMRAVEKFDHRKGFKFSTYATWWIRQAIGRGIADKGRTIRLPSHLMDTLATLSRSSSALLKALGREPTPAELAEDTGIAGRQGAVRAAGRTRPRVAVGRGGRRRRPRAGRHAGRPDQRGAVRRGRGRDRARRPALAARPARRARARDPVAALRPGRRPAAHARRGGPALQPDPRAHPPDRGQGAHEAAPPLLGAAPAPGRRARPADRARRRRPARAAPRLGSAGQRVVLVGGPRRRPAAGAAPSSPPTTRRPAPAAPLRTTDGSVAECARRQRHQRGHGLVLQRRAARRRRTTAPRGSRATGARPWPGRPPAAGRARNTTSMRWGGPSTTTAGAPEQLDVEADLLADLAAGAVGDVLAALDQPAGQPPAVAVGEADEEDAAVLALDDARGPDRERRGRDAGRSTGGPGVARGATHGAARAAWPFTTAFRVASGRDRPRRTASRSGDTLVLVDAGRAASERVEQRRGRRRHGRAAGQRGRGRRGRGRGRRSTTAPASAHTSAPPR